MLGLDRSKPVHIIVNPHSGYGSGRLMLADLRRELRQASLEVVEYTTKAPDDATLYAREHADEASVMLVWGGVNGLRQERAEREWSGA